LQSYTNFYESADGYQRQAVDFAMARLGSALFLDQGTGKTWCTAAVLQLMVAQSTGTSASMPSASASVASRPTWTGRSLDALLVVPLANIETTWERTLARVRDLVVCRDWDAFTRARGSHRCLLVHYEAMPRIIKRARKHDWNLIVYDESQRLKSRATRQSKIAEQLTWVRGKNARVINPQCRRILLSGTPIESNQLDLWAQFRFALPEVLPRRWATFERRWCKPTGYLGYKLKFREERMSAFLKLIGPHIFRVRRTDVLDLPPMKVIDVHVELLGQQARVYEDLTRRMTTTIDGHLVTADMAITQLVRQQQVTGGFIRLNPTAEDIRQGRKGRIVHVGNAKIRKLKALVAREEKPIVIFCRYRTEVRLIDQALERYRVAILTGKTKKKHRAGLLDDFQRGKYDVIICQVRVGGVGIDLYRACVAIFYSTTHSFIDYDQALARIHRRGQSRWCRILRLIALNTVDEEIFTAVSSKRRISNSTLRRTPVAKPDKKKTTIPAKPAPKAPPAPPTKAKPAAEEKPAKAKEERPKYGVPQLAEALGTKSASVRVRLRNLNIPKNGKTYGWNTKAEMQEVIDQLKKKASEKPAKASDDGDDTESEEEDEDEEEEEEEDSDDEDE
jgi:superfamily II DNA or RNA helicase